MKKEKYHIDNIRTLSILEAIRLRPQLYFKNLDFLEFSKIITSSFPYTFTHLKGKSIELILKDNLKGKIIFNNIKNKIPPKIATSIWVPGLVGMDSFLNLNATSNLFISKLSLGEKLLVEQHYEKGIKISGSEKNKCIKIDKWEMEFELDKTIWVNLKEWDMNVIQTELNTAMEKYPNQKYIT